jgi:hypothetical protein
MARSLRKNDSTMLMYSLAVRMRDTVLPAAHAAAVNSFRMSCASFLVGGPMMRDLSGAFSGSVRESYILASVFLPLRRMGSGRMPSPWRSWRCRCRSLANTRGRLPAVGSAGFSSGPSDRRTFLGFLSMHQGVDRRFEWTFMAPVCVRVAFIGGGQGEPSRWADRYSLRCACDTEAGIVANQNEKNCAENMKGFESAH